MSDDGAVVVEEVGGFPVNPYSWLSNTGSANILPHAGTWGPNAKETGVNRTGTVICGADWCNFATAEAVVWDGGGRYALSSTGTAGACGMSGDGTTVVGYDGSEAAFWTGNWSTGGTATSLPGFFQTQTARALGVNGDGSVIIGQESDRSSNQRGVRWVKTGSSYSVQNVPGVAGGTFERLTRVSSDGQVVVGYSLNGAGFYRAIRWTQAGGTQDLGDLPGAGSTAENEAWGVNSDGSIIVGFGDDSLGNTRAFRWTQASGLVDLNLWLPSQGVDLTGWTLERGLLVSDDSFMAGSGQFNGSPAGWIVTVAPVPEPGSVGLAASGFTAAGFGLWRRRRKAGRRGNA